MNDRTKPLLLTPPPVGSELRNKLEAKRLQYQARLAMNGQPWTGLDTKAAHDKDCQYRGIYYRLAILNELLKAKTPLDTASLQRELQDRHGKTFDARLFQDAHRIIAKYAGDEPNLEVHGGTGLRELAKV